jgi:hypothetical protein
MQTYLPIIILSLLALVSAVIFQLKSKSKQKNSIYRLIPNQAIAQAAKSAIAKQPDQIHLVRQDGYVWKQPLTVGPMIDDFRDIGFDDVGVFRVEGLSGVFTQFLLKEDDRLYAVIYEHPKIGYWMNVVARYEDGSGVTFATSPDRGMEPDPKFPVFHLPGHSAQQLYKEAISKRPQHPLKQLSKESIILEFEHAYSEQIIAQKKEGMSLATAINVVKKGQATEARPLHVQFLSGQEGSAEQALQALLRQILDRNKDIERAYLARVQHESAINGVPALCLVSKREADLELVEQLSSFFKEKFRQGIFMDIMFITRQQETKLSRLCSPFYQSSAQLRAGALPTG